MAAAPHPATTAPASQRGRIVPAAFVIAVFGWGVGFYGPPVFLHAVAVQTGWSMQLVSAAVTFHFVFGACVVAGLPRLQARWGVAATTAAGAAALAAGALGWSLATQPVHLFAAAALSGAGWAGMGAAAINAIVSPWFDRDRPVALARAYNGASLGGLLFSPLWSALVAWLGFVQAAAWVGVGMLGIVIPLCLRVLRMKPPVSSRQPQDVAPGHALWRHVGFRTLAAGMALGLFAQIGLISHLYTLWAVRLGPQAAGWAMAAATACAIAGRSLAGRRLRPGADRRAVAAWSYGVQLVGSLLMAAGLDHLPLMGLGLVLFGLGLGNATSLPPLVVQGEFAPADTARVVALVVAISQATYAFAPAAFAWLLGPGGDALGLFVAAAVLQAAALGCLRAGRPATVPPTTQGPP
ncbi:MFS transporter [Ramlibacter tataouinensis]|uniref:Candidate transporter n=1 Tax=Ramlibacter tataouinensis (strain ATCC BAA-407 / DSM 14655 / LMG 21543 / TTB310) TaxID=365046 RepID=F5Y4Z8_RAMTT|nr:MFS transporter [Ramlibacter tataouinensis]AEG93838.1 Candidate transporter [Ramlibacter tataouinensis TTB310]